MVQMVSSVYEQSGVKSSKPSSGVAPNLATRSRSSPATRKVALPVQRMQVRGIEQERPIRLRVLRAERGLSPHLPPTLRDRRPDEALLLRDAELIDDDLLDSRKRRLLHRLSRDDPKHLRILIPTSARAFQLRRGTATSHTDHPHSNRRISTK